MPIPKELVDLLKEHDLEVERKRTRIIATHKELPVSLIIRISGDKAIIELEAGDELRDVLVDLIESGEDIESMVDDVLSELRDIAIEASQLLSDKGLEVELRLREGESDIRDVLEDVMEEYGGEFEEE
jgi:signal transduction histidine kinase